jgi:flagellar biosynthesis chaperone FliJ
MSTTEDLAQQVKELEQRQAEILRQLKTVERERIEYLQNVSHQLVAPLNAIKWHIET